MYAVIGTNSWGGAIYEKLLRGSSVDKNILKQTAETAAKCELFMFDTASNYGFGKSQKLIGELCPKETEISAKFTPSKKYKKGQVKTALEKTSTDRNGFLRIKRHSTDMRLPQTLSGRTALQGGKNKIIRNGNNRT